MTVLDDLIKKAQFFESEEFDQAMEIISQHKMINQERMKYDQQVIPGLSYETFSDVCNSVFQYSKRDLLSDQDSQFPTFYIDYQGVRFNLMIGQGSTYWTEKLDQED